MKWLKVGKKALLETESGFVIELISGDWIMPLELKLHSSSCCLATEQAYLIKKGLDYMNNKIVNFQYIKESDTTLKHIS